MIPPQDIAGPGFLAYFCEGMADAFSAVRAQAAKAAHRGAPDRAGQLRKLDPRERRLLVLFRRHGAVTAAEIAEHLGRAQRTVVGLCRAWLKKGFMELKNPSRKNRSYRLGKAFEFLIE